jgi:hypothetical protein
VAFLVAADVWRIAPVLVVRLSRCRDGLSGQTYKRYVQAHKAKCISIQYHNMLSFRVRELDRGRAVKILNVQEFMQDAGYELPRIHLPRTL